MNAKVIHYIYKYIMESDFYVNIYGIIVLSTVLNQFKIKFKYTKQV